MLEEILQPRLHPLSTEVTIIDSAEEEAKGEDFERVNEIKKEIEQITEDYRDQNTDPNKSPGSINITYKLITENIRLVRALDLVGDKEVDRITAGNGMDPEDWWLQDDYIEENLDFAKGVIRRRGLSKALYYKTYAEDDLSTIIDVPAGAEIAILVGLGGGTGAGMVLDLATHVKEQVAASDITLFGVLPNNAEGERENSNAFALLSEIEYSTLNDDMMNPFEDCILFSIQPTDYQGKRNDMGPSKEHLREFDEAFVYSFLLHYNHPMDSIASPDFAPFKMAVPLLLRYNIEAIEEFRSEVDEILEYKEQSMKAESNLYDEVEGFLTQHYPDTEGELSDEDLVDLNRRIDRIESLIGLDLFEDLEYDSVSVFRTEVLEPARAEIDADEEDEEAAIDQLIDVMVGSVEAKTLQHLDTAVEDQRVAEVLERDVLLLGRRKRILQRLKGVSDPKIRGALEYLVGLREGNAGAKANQLKEEHKTAKAQRESTEQRLEDKRAELETLRQQQADEIEQKTTQWSDNVAEQLEQLQTLSSVPLRRDVESLRSTLQDFSRRLERARSKEEAESIDTTEVTNAIEILDEDLETAEIYANVSEIENAVQKAQKARKAHFDLYSKVGIWKYLPWKTKAEKQKENAQKQFSAQRAQLGGGNPDAFKISDKGGEFNCDVTFDGQELLDELEAKQRDLSDQIVGEFERIADEPPREDVENLRDELEHGASGEQLEEVVSSALERQISGVEEARSRIQSLESKLEQERITENLYESAHTAVTEFNAHTTQFNDGLEEFRDGLNAVIETSPRQTDVREDYSYRKDVQPHNVFRATGTRGLLESELLDNPGEKQRAIEHINELANRACSEPYCGLRTRKLIADGRRYDKHQIRIGLSSEIDLSGLSRDLQDTFESAFELDKSRLGMPYGQWQQDFGGPWDIGMTAFIYGVFLDNLRPAVGPSGYQQIYQDQESKLGEEILIHHALGLESGQLVRRKRMLNIENTDDVEFYLRDEHEVAADLLDEFETVPLKTEDVDV